MECVVLDARFARGAEECLRPYTNWSSGFHSHRGTSTLRFIVVCRASAGTVWHDEVMRFYRRNLPHLQKDFTPHFVTFVTKFRWILPPSARDTVLSCCCHDHRKRYELYVVVVMPDHVHLILTPLIDRQRGEIFSLTKITQAIKAASARAINLQLTRDGAVWQEESFDHVMRSSESLDAKVDYVLRNPVRRGLVKNFWEYRWLWQRTDRASAEMRVVAQDV